MNKKLFKDLPQHILDFSGFVVKKFYGSGLEHFASLRLFQTKLLSGLAKYYKHRGDESKNKKRIYLFRWLAAASPCELARIFV
ncbi:MAG: hypothetical protein LBK13_07090 [Spirochaetales bacterium]|nr:hypothetical protein [Spirochaetales bacterium]